MSNSLSKIKLYLLGPMRLWKKNEKTNLPYQKAGALLAYLAVTGRQHSRDRLATLLWGNATEKNAQSSLRNALYILRENLSPDIFRAERKLVGINDEIIWLDVNFLLATTKSPNPDIHKLQTALDMWKGPFLEGLYISSALTFEDWMIQKRRQISISYQAGLLHLSKHFINLGQQGEALEVANRLLQIDPLSESSHRHVMRIHLIAGDRSAALKQYDRLQQRLQDELGVEPDPTTQALYNKAINLQVTQSKPSQLTPFQPVSVPTSINFVGRQQELNKLSQQWQSVSLVGPAQMVLVNGEAGIGKTRLLSEWMQRLKGALCLTTRCFETETSIPYHIWNHILREAHEHIPIESLNLAGLWLNELANLLPDLRREHPKQTHVIYKDSDFARGRLIQGVYQWIKALSQIQPICLFIDDLQWIDQASLLLLKYILMNGDELPCLVLGAQRSAETRSNWKKAQTTLTRVGHLHQIHLRRLSFDEVCTLVSILDLPTAEPISFLQRIFQETEGNPLFVVELVHTLQRMNLSTADMWPVPSTIQGVIRARISRLSPRTRQVLSLASVIEQNFTPQFLEVASQNNSKLIQETFDEALDANVLVEQVEGAYKFSHEKIRCVLYEDLKSERRKQLHQQVAQTLEGQREEGGRIDFGLLSHHYQAAGDMLASLKYALRAARHAVELYVNEDALTWYNRAKQLEENNEIELPPSFIKEALPFGQIYLAAELPLDVLGLVYRQRGLIFQRTGSYHKAEKDFYAALQRGRERGRIDEQGAAHNLLSFLAYLRSQYELVAEHAQKTLGFGSQANIKRLHAAGLRNLGIAAYQSHDFTRALALYMEALSVYEIVNDKIGVATCYNNIGFALRTLRRYNEAISAFQQAYSLYKNVGQTEGQAVILANIGRTYAAQGNSEKALHSLEHAHQLSEETQINWIAAKIWRTMGRVYSQNHRWAEALEAAHRAQELAGVLGSDEDVGATYRLLGEIAANWPESDLGDPSTYFERSLDILEQVGEQHELERTRASFESYKKNKV